MTRSRASGTRLMAFMISALSSIRPSMASSTSCSISIMRAMVSSSRCGLGVPLGGTGLSIDDALMASCRKADTYSSLLSICMLMFRACSRYDLASIRFSSPSKSRFIVYPHFLFPSCPGQLSPPRSVRPGFRLYIPRLSGCAHQSYPWLRCAV